MIYTEHDRKAVKVGISDYCTARHFTGFCKDGDCVLCPVHDAYRMLVEETLSGKTRKPKEQ